MKKWLLLSLVQFAALASCSDDNVPPEPPVNPPEAEMSSLRLFPLSSYSGDCDRCVPLGREIAISACSSPGSKPAFFNWKINGEAERETGRVICFTPSAPGIYNIEVSADIDGSIHRCSCVVTVTDTDENSLIRMAGEASSPYATKVYEYLPGPGQYVADVTAGSAQEAAAWAQARLENGRMVSLGSFGGYITVGFDHSVMASQDGFDFALRGNAFVAENGSSNEPGIVWVMQDVNGNGLPDDEWYELIGSEYFMPDTEHDTYVTYFDPGLPDYDVEWTDAGGETGQVTFLSSLKGHGRQYFPAWIQTGYTLFGSRIPARNSLNQTTFMWENRAYPWGYADNIGSDCITELNLGPGSYTGFRISNAVNAAGHTVELKYIDFIKIQCATLAQSGPLGELSTEIFNIIDLNISR